MEEKPDTWLWKEQAAPLQAVGAGGHAPASGEAVVEVEACKLAIDPAGCARPQSRIEGRVVEAGEGALFFVDRSVALPGVVPCGQQDRCLTGEVQSCPRQEAGGDAPPPHQVIVPAHALSVRDERLSRAPAVDTDQPEEG